MTINYNLGIFVKLTDSNIGESDNNINERRHDNQAQIFIILAQVAVNKRYVQHAQSNRIIGVRGDTFSRVRKESGSVQDCKTKFEHKVANVTDNINLCCRKIDGDMTVIRGLNFGYTSVDVELKAEWQIMIQDIDLRNNITICTYTTCYLS